MCEQKTCRRGPSSLRAYALLEVGMRPVKPRCRDGKNGGKRCWHAVWPGLVRYYRGTTAGQKLIRWAPWGSNPQPAD
jgi:hypothetical protein